MNAYRHIFLFCCLCLLIGCKDYKSEFTDVSIQDEKVFNGSIIEFLEKGDPDLNLHFDSMLVVINGIPGLRDSLEKTTAPKTVFAVPNTCFQEAMLQLNNYRQAKNRGKVLSLQDLLIEPFVVIEEKQGPTPDSIIVIEHPYDYRLQLDSLVSHYIFQGNINATSLVDYPTGLHTKDYKFSYLMHILFERRQASGIEQMGKKRLILSDKNNTQVDASWNRSETQVIDIKTSNGYIHVLTDGHEFGFSKMIANFQNYGNEYIYD